VRTSTGSAERLQRAAGTWRLEFQQLVYNSPSMLRPRRFSVQGELAILQQLREFAGHEPLAKDAERLFARGALPEGTYVVRDGRWFPELAPEALREIEPPPPAAAASAAAPGALEELTKRVIALDATVRSMQQSLDQALRALAEAASVAARAPAHIAHAGAPPPAAAAAAAPKPIPIVSAVAGATTAAAGAASIPGPVVNADGSERAAITLPSLAAISDLMRSLAGPEATLTATDRVDWPIVAAGSPVFCAVIQDKDGDEAGSMIFDLEAALRLAGALLMESEELITSLLEEKIMSDEMLDAASEVCNTLTSAFNKVSGNPHVRSGKMQPLSDARAAELARARKRDDYRYSQGGRISFIGC
jgi:hypothetical protein